MHEAPFVSDCATSLDSSSEASVDSGASAAACCSMLGVVPVVASNAAGDSAGVVESANPKPGARGLSATSSPPWGAGGDVAEGALAAESAPAAEKPFA